MCWWAASPYRHAISAAHPYRRSRQPDSIIAYRREVRARGRAGLRFHLACCSSACFTVCFWGENQQVVIFWFPNFVVFSRRRICCGCTCFLEAKADVAWCNSATKTQMEKIGEFGQPSLWLWRRSLHASQKPCPSKWQKENANERLFPSTVWLLGTGSSTKAVGGASSPVGKPLCEKKRAQHDGVFKSQTWNCDGNMRIQFVSCINVRRETSDLCEVKRRRFNLRKLHLPAFSNLN